jgi:hypothetical protein
MRITGIHEREGPWYVVGYDLLDMKQEQVTPLGRLDWADWDANGDLLFAREGRLYRLEPRRKAGGLELREPQLVADLRGHKFEHRAAPPEATRW